MKLHRSRTCKELLRGDNEEVPVKGKNKMFSEWFDYYIGIKDEYRVQYYGIMSRDYHLRTSRAGAYYRENLAPPNAYLNRGLVSASNAGITFDLHAFEV